jgi:Glycosyltransferase family 87
MERATGAVLASLLGLLLASNLILDQHLEPKLVNGLLALSAIPLLLSRGRPPRLLLVLLFGASAWNNLVNVKYAYGPLHYHDAGHYYLGSRYFDELGYFHLYDGVLLVLSESDDPPKLPEQVRDLRDNRLVDPGELLARHRLSAADFSDSRWRDFRTDVDTIVQGLGPRLDAFLRDHGYNPTPVWTWLARPLAESVPAGSTTGLLLLSFIDPLLLMSAVAALGWAFGRDAAWLAGSYLLLMFGTVTWIGGSFCRYAWLALLIWGFCCLKRQKPFLAGSCLALAATLRVFPVLFLVPLTLKVWRGVWRRRRIAVRYRRLLAGAAVTASTAVAGATAALGVGAWVGFFENMSAYVRIDVSNAIGFQKILGIGAGIVGSPPASPPASWLILAACGLLAAIVALAASRSRDLAALSGGALLCFLVFDLGAYYYVFLVLPFVVADGARRRAGFFAVEAVCYLVHFAFGPEQQVQFLVRNLAVGLLLFDLWLDRGAREAGHLAQRLRSSLPGSTLWTRRAGNRLDR